jgi:beta-glucanase (GH16 family)
LPDSSNLQEIDYEYLIDATSTSQPKPNTKSLLYTNHAPTTEDATTSPAPSEAQTALHEYRVDWVPGKTAFYLDGVQKSTITARRAQHAGTVDLE